jgi:YD repeat-containing protein
LNAHIWDRVTEKKIYDAGSVLKAHSQFSYDTTSITSTSGVPQHDYSGYPYTYTIRGNQTLVKRWRNTDSAWLTTTHYYNDVGNLIQTTDPGSHTTTFSYADNYSDGANRTSQAYVTQITFPSTGGINHIEKKQYFWSTGLVAAACGQNFSGSCVNTLTPPQPDYSKFTYDLLGRPITVIMADGGQNTFAYTEPSTPSPSNPIKVSASTKMNATQNLVGIATIDGLGRVKRAEQCEDGSPTCSSGIKVDTTFDALSRKSTVTNPYRTTGDSTYGVTTYEYDGIGRVSSVTAPSGGAATTSYSGNTVTATDPQGKKRKSETDAQGRMTRVWEPDSSGSFIYESAYLFDVLDNLTRVDQKGNDANSANWRTRTYTYNSLSQMLSASNPETGTTNYSYDSDGNLYQKTDARSITITHAYDALHRLTSKTYSNGDPTAAFTYDVSSIDGLSIQYPSAGF